MAKKPEETKEFVIELKKYETFLDQRLQEFLKEVSNNEVAVTIGAVARLMKAYRIFVEQTVRRIAHRNGWNWAQPGVVVTRKKTTVVTKVKPKGKPGPKPKKKK